MITGRIARHIKAQNWTAVLLDLLIVILGVFIGLQVSNWNNERQSDVRSQQVIVQLKSDRLILPALSVLLDMNKAELNYRTQIRDKAQQLSEILVTKF